MITEITDATFNSHVLQARQPILVDYWAPWCGPCKQLTPILEDIARDYTHLFTVAKINVDDNPGTAGKQRVTGLPTLHLYIAGKLAASITGAQPKQRIIRTVTKAIEEAETR